MDLDNVGDRLKEFVDDATAMIERLAGGDTTTASANEIIAKIGALALSNSQILIALLEERAAARDTP